MLQLSAASCDIWSYREYQHDWVWAGALEVTWAIFLKLTAGSKLLPSPS